MQREDQEPLGKVRSFWDFLAPVKLPLNYDFELYKRQDPEAKAQLEEIRTKSEQLHNGQEVTIRRGATAINFNIPSEKLDTGPVRLLRNLRGRLSNVTFDQRGGISEFAAFISLPLPPATAISDGKEETDTYAWFHRRELPKFKKVREKGQKKAGGTDEK